MVAELLQWGWGRTRNRTMRRILIIEDDRVDREIYKHCLKQSIALQFDFVESGSAAGGIELSKTWGADCILLDFNLPDMDGLEVLPLLRREDGRLPCAVVMLTACGGEELAVNAMKAGAMDYLPKGQVSAEVLPQKVVNAIERFQMLQRIDEQRSALERSAQQYQTLLEAIPQMVWMANPHGQVEYANSQWFDYTGLNLAGPGRLPWDDVLYPEDRQRTVNAWALARQSGSVFEIEHRLRRASDRSFRWHLVRAVPVRDSTGAITNWFGTCTEIESQKQAEAHHLQKEKLQSIGLLAAGIAHDFNNLLVVILGGTSYAMGTLPSAHKAQGMLRDVVLAAERAAELTRKMLAYAGKANQYIEPTDINKLVNDTCNVLRPSVPEGIEFHVSPGRDLPSVTTDSRQMRQVIVDLVMNALEAIREGSAGTISVRTSAIELDEGALSDVSAGKYVALDVLDTGCGMNEETQRKIFDPFFSTKFAGRGLGLAAVHGFVRSNGGSVEVDSAPGKGTRFRVLLPVMS
jgi:PAS domain S-box-containing protein